MSKGAFIEALEHVIEDDMGKKRKLLKFILDNPNHPLTKECEKLTPFELIFGDYQRFANKFNKALNND